MKLSDKLNETLGNGVNYDDMVQVVDELENSGGGGSGDDVGLLLLGAFPEIENSPAGDTAFSQYITSSGQLKVTALRDGSAESANYFLPYNNPAKPRGAFVICYNDYRENGLFSFSTPKTRGFGIWFDEPLTTLEPLPDATEGNYVLTVANTTTVYMSDANNIYILPENTKFKWVRAGV